MNEQMKFPDILVKSSFVAAIAPITPCAPQKIRHKSGKCWASYKSPGIWGHKRPSIIASTNVQACLLTLLTFVSTRNTLKSAQSRKNAKLFVAY